MIFYKNDYAIEKTLKHNRTPEQMFLKSVTGKDFSHNEALNLSEKIGDHKWYVSEKLGRDVGSKVAAIDFFENIYDEKTRNNQLSRRFDFNLRAKLALLT